MLEGSQERGGITAGNAGLLSSPQKVSSLYLCQPWCIVKNSIGTKEMEQAQL
jgi:hypothetical protein